MASNNAHQLLAGLQHERLVKAKASMARASARRHLPVGVDEINPVDPINPVGPMGPVADAPICHPTHTDFAQAFVGSLPSAVEDGATTCVTCLRHQVQQTLAGGLQKRKTLFKRGNGNANCLVLVGGERELDDRRENLLQNATCVSGAIPQSASLALPRCWACGP